MKRLLPVIFAIGAIVMLVACVITCVYGANAIMDIKEADKLDPNDLYVFFLYPAILFLLSAGGVICSYCVTHLKVHKIIYRIFRILMYIFIVICALSFIVGFFTS